LSEKYQTNPAKKESIVSTPRLIALLASQILIGFQ
jgi:hypothetical protein